MIKIDARICNLSVTKSSYNNQAKIGEITEYEISIINNGPDKAKDIKIMDVNRAAKENCNFRKSVWTGKCMQMTLMSIPPRGEIGLEVHEKTDQMIRVERE